MAYFGNYCLALTHKWMHTHPLYFFVSFISVCLGSNGKYQIHLSNNLLMWVGTQACRLLIYLNTQSSISPRSAFTSSFSLSSVHLSHPPLSSLVSFLLFVRLVLSCCLRFHMSCSVIACPRHSTRLHIFVGAVMEGSRDWPLAVGQIHLVSPHLVHAFTCSSFAPKLQF